MSTAEQQVQEETQPAAEVEATPEKQAPRPEDYAARDYMQLIPHFKSELDKCNNSAARRLLEALLEYPFANNRPTFVSPIETQLFNVGLQINDCKHVLMKAVLELKQEDIKKLSDETATQGEGSNV